VAGGARREDPFRDLMIEAPAAGKGRACVCASWTIRRMDIFFPHVVHTSSAQPPPHMWYIPRLPSPPPHMWYIPAPCAPSLTLALSADQTFHVTHPMSLAAPAAAAGGAPDAPPPPPPPPPLPEGWEAAWSEEDRDYYFFREDTGEVTWDLPK